MNLIGLHVYNNYFKLMEMCIIYWNNYSKLLETKENIYSYSCLYINGFLV